MNLYVREKELTFLFGLTKDVYKKSESRDLIVLPVIEASSKPLKT